MPTMRCMVILNMTSGVPEDACVNTLHFFGEPTPGNLAGISTAIGVFYDSISGVLARTISFAASRLKFYNLDHSMPRAPIHETALTAGSEPVNTPLPHELCMCLSFEGLRISGIPQARRRGRIYLGPLGTNVLTSNGDLSTTETDVVRDAAQVFVQTSDTTPDWSWVVLSRASTPDAPAIVQSGWVDNAFDVQRRRGIKASSRLIFSTP